jgi:hypothetical protein
MTAAPATPEALRQAWEEQMEIAHDTLPPWYWSRPQREARRDAWVAARLANPSHPDRSATP